MNGGCLRGQGVVVTGGGRGIGAALAERAVAEAASVVLNDLDADACRETAERIGALAVPGDCASAPGVAALLGAAREHLGRVDVYVANAGVERSRPDSLQAPDEDWDVAFETHVMAHVRAARELVPAWVGGGGGRFVVTASAAGLLTMLGAAPYTASKHAAIAFAEWLSITYGSDGVTVQAICPQGVRTRMLDQAPGPLRDLVAHDAAIDPQQVAAAWIDSLADGRFLVLPHPEVGEYYATRATRPDRWLAGMRRLQRRIDQDPGGISA